MQKKIQIKKTPFEIEQYFETSNILKDRVLTSLTAYRKEWRNPSTHNYQLFFTEQESLLAIANVSTFCIILLEQITTKANENYERERAQEFSNQVISSIPNYQNLPFEKRVFSLLAKSYEFIQLPQKSNVKGYEYIGLLTGYIEAVDPSIDVSSDVKLSYSMNQRADLILSSGGEKVLVEIKRRGFFHRYRDRVTAQVLHYLELAKIKNGVLMVFDEVATKGTWSTQQTLFGEGPYVTYVNPSE